jgi:hypothetical protein
LLRRSSYGSAIATDGRVVIAASGMPDPNTRPLASLIQIKALAGINQKALDRLGKHGVDKY